MASGGKCGSYAGKVKNRSTQDIKAPFGGSGAVKGNQKVTGSDLRSGGSSGKKSGK